MVFNKNRKDVSFFGVGMALILVGAVVIAVGIAKWALGYAGDDSSMCHGAKFFAGLIILALGYIVLQLELMRKNK